MSISLIIGKNPKQWVVTKEIVASVYEGRSIDNKQQVAIKIEERDGRTRSKLKREKTFFDKLSKGGLADGFPNVHYFEIGEDYNVMVLDKFGPSLAFLFQFCDGQFSLKTVIELVDQLLHRLEFIHSKGIIYGDINLNNFLMQTEEGLGVVNVISFGLARTYLDDKGDHVHLDLQRSFGGSLNFASRNAHLKRTLSRRDDLESLGYFMVYLLKGALPWCNTKAVNTRDLRNIIGKTKLKTNFKDLCKHLPGADTFMAYFNYVENLDFEDKPDYEKMRKLFRGLALEFNIQFDGKYDWVVHNYKAHFLQLSIPKFMLIAAKKKRGLMDKQFVAREQKRMMDLIALDERSRVMDNVENNKKSKNDDK